MSKVVGWRAAGLLGRAQLRYTVAGGRPGTCGQPAPRGARVAYAFAQHRSYENDRVGAPASLPASCNEVARSGGPIQRHAMVGDSPVHAPPLFSRLLRNRFTGGTPVPPFPASRIQIMPHRRHPPRPSGRAIPTPPPRPRTRPSPRARDHCRNPCARRLPVPPTRGPRENRIARVSGAKAARRLAGSTG